MLTLFLDTASKNHTLALCNEEETIGLEHFEARNDAAITPAIEEMLKKNDLEYESLSHLACAVGPGGFTSLRIGVTAINTLAFTLNIPSIGVHLSDLWSVRAQAQARTPFLWLHSTRRTQIFVKGFGNDGTSTPIDLFDLDDAKQLQGSYVGELIPEHQELLRNCHPMPEENLTPLEEMLPTFLKKRRYAKQQLTPWYGREG